MNFAKFINEMIKLIQLNTIVRNYFRNITTAYVFGRYRFEIHIEHDFHRQRWRTHMETRTFWYAMPFHCFCFVTWFVLNIKQIGLYRHKIFSHNK